MYARHQMGLHRSLTVLALACAGCPTVDLGDTPDDINRCNPAGGLAYFQSEIYPKFIRGDDPTNTRSCTQNNGCHNEGGGTALSFRIQGRRDDVFNFRVTQLFLECGAREQSLLLTKPLAGVTDHQGGSIFATMSDAEVQTFLGWF